MAEVLAMNDNPDINGIIVQMPLPAGVNWQRVAETIAPHKDADACHPSNAANVYSENTWTSVVKARRREGEVFPSR